jgi:FAD/FMN-containing dehydrogenase
MTGERGSAATGGTGGGTGRTISRRSFLTAGAGTLAAAAAAAARKSRDVLGDLPDSRADSTADGRADSTADGRGANTAAITAARLRSVPWTGLAASLAGTLVLPGDAAYPVATQLYNERFDGVAPAAVAFCQRPADVQRCVAFARHHSVQVAARSGGHSYGGYSSCSGLVVDVTRMAAVQVAANRRTATIGAGARLIDIYAALGQSGVLLPGGSCPTVGIAGLALGGGVSVFGRRFGLTCDQLHAVDLVTADAQVRACDRSKDADLLWASQGGGGGNFGIATSFTFDVHPVPPVALFTLAWPWAAAGDVLTAWLQWLPGTPDELWANCQLLSSGMAGGATSLTVKVTGVFCGSAAALAGALQPLRNAVGGAPTYDFVGPEDYLPAMLIEAGCEGMSVAACHLPSQNPSGTLSRSAFAAKSAYVMRVPPAGGIAAFTEAVRTLDGAVPDVGGGISLDAYGGAINRVPPSATAFVHRNAIAGVQWSCSWDAGAPAPVVSAAESWLVSTAHAIRPYVEGAYQNYIDPTLEDWEQAYYGANLPRLVGVKRSVDPDNFFHFAQSIPVRLRSGSR